VSRFYRNPFVKDAPLEHLVEETPERYVGPAFTKDGCRLEHVRERRYSGGSVVTVSRAPLIVDVVLEALPKRYLR
jgi:hypothetical protein